MPTSPRNPAALLWALMLGSEARVTEAMITEVRAMSNNHDAKTLARAHTLLVAIDEAVICNPDLSRIAELLGDRFMNPWAGDMRSLGRSLAAAAEIAALRAQLAEAREREQAQRTLAGKWVSNYLGLLIDVCETPGNETMLEILRPQLERIAVALRCGAGGKR